MINAVFGLLYAVGAQLLPLLKKVNYLLFENGGSPLVELYKILT